MTKSLNRVILESVLFVAIMGFSSQTHSHRVRRCSPRTSTLTFPDDFKYCKADSSNSSCLVDLIQDTLIKLGTKGISSPINFNINPMTLDFWNFQVEVDAVKTHEYFWDLKHPTLWNATVLFASFDTSSLTLTYTTFHDHLAQYNGRYKIWGQLYHDQDSNPEVIYGNGTADRHVYNLTLEHTIVFVPADIKNTQYFFVGSYDLTVIGFTDATFNYQNLYNGDQTLGKRAGYLMNENAVKIVFHQVDSFTELLVTMLKQYTQTLVSSVPSSKILAHLAG
ncbi:unnamed protein product [Phaedon cochleariae]|uniref:Uncharacterized protein n=1 Tax=Phaedon cochleariae TaxID=80249 RepID=A0A9P0GU63_PHACE|nr:unnamed protein product [Phaedon cochleariae]